MLSLLVWKRCLLRIVVFAATGEKIGVAVGVSVKVSIDVVVPKAPSESNERGISSYPYSVPSLVGIQQKGCNMMMVESRRRRRRQEESEKSIESEESQVHPVEGEPHMVERHPPSPR